MEEQDNNVGIHDALTLLVAKWGGNIRDEQTLSLLASYRPQSFRRLQVLRVVTLLVGLATYNRLQPRTWLPLELWKRVQRAWCGSDIIPEYSSEGISEAGEGFHVLTDAAKTFRRIDETNMADQQTSTANEKGCEDDRDDESIPD